MLKTWLNPFFTHPGVRWSRSNKVFLLAVGFSRIVYLVSPELFLLTFLLFQVAGGVRSVFSYSGEITYCSNKFILKKLSYSKLQTGCPTKLDSWGIV